MGSFVCTIFVMCCELELSVFILTWMVNNEVYSRCRIVYSRTAKGWGTDQIWSHLIGDWILPVLFCLVLRPAVVRNGGYKWIVYICFVLYSVIDTVEVTDDWTLKTEIEKCGESEANHRCCWSGCEILGVYHWPKHLVM